MSAPEAHVMCPTCRIAIPDRDYDRHCQTAPNHNPRRRSEVQWPREDEER